GQTELVDRLLDRGHVMEEVDLGAGPGGASPDDQTRLSIDRLPGERDLALVDEVADGLRDRSEHALESGGRVVRLAAGRDDDRGQVAELEIVRQRRDLLLGRWIVEAGRGEDRQIESGLVAGVVEGLLMEASVDEDLRGESEDRRGQDDEEDDRRGEAGPDAADHRAPRSPARELGSPAWALS